MIFLETAVAGVYRIDPELREDHRGFFARVWCERELLDRGLEARIAQSSVSFTRRRRTLRGLHFQVPPCGEVKLVRCTRGAIYDVALDVRPDSPTFLRHAAVELTAENRRTLYIPVGCAHGFQTLSDDAEVFYQMSEFYSPEYARGVRWNDPRFGIKWPIEDPILHERDAAYPDFAVQATQ